LKTLPGKRLSKNLKIVALCLFILFAAFDRTGLAARADGAAPAVGHSPAAAATPGDAAQNPCVWPLPVMPSDDPDRFQKLLSDYLQQKCYKRPESGWMGDNQIRDTGPFIPNNTANLSKGGKTLGTHNAVRVYYSPEVWKWMTGDRKNGDIPDGATIIKEMYPTPAQQKVDADYSLTGYAIMVKDKKGSWDGWFWSDGSPTIDYSGYPNAGFGLYCINCHASAHAEVTFSASRNVTGSPLVFNQTMAPFDVSKAKSPDAAVAPPRVVAPSRVVAPVGQVEEKAQEEDDVHLRRALGGKAREESRVDMVVHAGRAPAAGVPKKLVSEWYDTVVQNPQGQKSQMFVTANQCFGCHDATQNNATIPNMVYPQVYPTAKGQTELNVNVSPYGEWRSSMMGLSGRDPVFFAQLETEMNLHPEIKEQIVDTCLSCHGVMGQRQVALDKKGPFRLEYLDRFGSQPFAEYGGLARDGVSCAVCHHISAEGLGTPATYTGKFNLGNPDEIFGPYKDVATLPMKNGLGLTPLKTKENQIRSSALCGSCHTVILPVLKVGEKYPPGVFEDAMAVERGDRSRMGDPGEPLKVEHEQNTYLEWLNSKYQNERPPFHQADVQTCQDCHMPANYPSKTGPRLNFKAASIEEDIFAATDYRAPDEEIHLRVRGPEADEPFSRHTLLGMNIFALKMFAQNPDTLGVAFSDPMATYGNAVPSLVAAQKSALELARAETAQVEITSVRRTAKSLRAEVKVSNLAGHKFPSGVSFRRAFVELRVLDSAGRTLWVSGGTNKDGVIGTTKAGKFTSLVTEFFDLKSNPQQKYQPHFDASHPITSEEQVQIYEELVKDTNGVFTTSFLSLADPVKDNRMMPQGWSKNGPEAGDTKPLGVDESSNPGYFDGTGSSVLAYEIPLSVGAKTVTATIYYQTIPPYYLLQRYTGAPQGLFTQSLKFYVDNLKVDGVDDDCKANNDGNCDGGGCEPCQLLLGEAPVKNWKLMIVGASKTL
jgi:hypothetical protein